MKQKKNKDDIQDYLSQVEYDLDYADSVEENLQQRLAKRKSKNRKKKQNVRNRTI